MIEKFTFFQSLVKNAKFLSSLFFFKKGLNMYFYDVVYRKGSFLDQKMSFSYTVVEIFELCNVVVWKRRLFRL